MKRIALVILAVLLFASAADKTPQQNYIDTYSTLARAEMQRTGVPASITLAQGLLESNSGQSALAVKANNHFGVKCHNWKGATTFADDDAKNECFRAYKTPEESFRDHSDFLRYQDRYKSLFNLEATDYKAWAKGLKQAGYATDPQYANKLIRIIEDYGLYAYDTLEGGETIEVPETPEEVETPQKVRSEKPSGNYQESVSIGFQRPVYRQNGVEFIYALEGETYSNIASSHNLFLKEILAFNDLAADAPLRNGDMVYLQRKKSQAAKGVDKYVVGSEGETMRDIAQRFGVREKSLRKLSGLSSGQPSEGDVILLRRQK